MNYKELLQIKKSKAFKKVTSVFGDNITESSAYNKIYDLSEMEFHLDSGGLSGFIQGLINLAAFAGMAEEARNIQECFKNYEINEAAFGVLF